MDQLCMYSLSMVTFVKEVQNHTPRLENNVDQNFEEQRKDIKKRNNCMRISVI